MSMQKPLSPVKKLQQRIDALIVQLDLGKLEAVAGVEEQIHQLRTRIDHLGHAANEATLVALKQHLEDLQVQLKLGKMETKEAYLHEREALETKIAAARHSLSEAKHTAEEDFSEVAHALTDKMNMLALNLGAAGILAQESVAHTKTKFRERFAQLSGTLQAEAELAGEKAHQLAEDSRDALEDIFGNLRSLIGR